MTQYFVYFLLSLPLVGAYALLGLGITVIYQASRVLNLAHGAMAMGGAYATYQFYKSVGPHIPDQIGAPLIASVLFGVVIGAAFGLLIERIFVRRLRSAGPTTQTVGTVAVLTFSIAIVSRIWGTQSVSAPRIIPRSVLSIGRDFVPWPKLAIFPIALGGAALMFALFQYTDVGLAMRGAAQNRRGAALRGVDPDRTAAFAWALGGAFAALAGILLAGSTQLDPFNISLGILPAFVAALIGGLESLPGVCVGAVIVGIIQGMVPAVGENAPGLSVLLQGQGAPELVLGVLALVVMALRGARLSTGDVRDAL